MTKTSCVSKGSVNSILELFSNLDYRCYQAALAAIGLEALPNCQQVGCLVLGRLVINPIIVMSTGAVLVRIGLSFYPALLREADVNFKATVGRNGLLLLRGDLISWL
jgi:hypothetical protein